MEKLKHTKGPFGLSAKLPGHVFDSTGRIMIANCLSHSQNFGDTEDLRQRQYGNAVLFSIGDTAPHSCSDSACPGDINRRKLQAAEEMADCLASLLVAALSSKSEDWTRASQYAYAALSAWENAGKEKGGI